MGREMTVLEMAYQHAWAEKRVEKFSAAWDEAFHCRKITMRVLGD